MTTHSDPERRTEKEIWGKSSPFARDSQREKTNRSATEQKVDRLADRALELGERVDELADGETDVNEEKVWGDGSPFAPTKKQREKIDRSETGAV